MSHGTHEPGEESWCGSRGPLAGRNGRGVGPGLRRDPGTGAGRSGSQTSGARSNKGFVDRKREVWAKEESGETDTLSCDPFQNWW